MNFFVKTLKNCSVAFYLIAVAFVAILVAFIGAIVSNGVVGYSIASFGWVIVLSLAAIFGTVLSCVLSQKVNNSLLSYIGLIVSIVACGVCFAIILMARAELVGTLWITALDSVNPLAVAAMNSGATSFIAYVIAMIMLVIAAFFPIVKKENNA